MVTGRGLASNLRHNFPRGIVWAACGLLIIANVVNIGAELGGMAEATGMMTGTSQYIWTPIYAVLIISLLFWTSYNHIAKVFKWLALILVAYIIAAFLAHPD
jgi:Mn2+/Fe2+ NRAMP family transporter